MVTSVSVVDIQSTLANSSFGQNYIHLFLNMGRNSGFQTRLDPFSIRSAVPCLRASNRT